MSYDILLNDGDMVVDTQGDLLVVLGYDKLYQDLNRLIYTARGENKFDLDEGCGVYALLGRAMPQDLAESVMSKDLYFGLLHMIDQQNAQALSQALSPFEQIATVDEIAFTKVALKKIEFDVALTTIRGQQIAFSFLME
jgi:hypothetical protein